MQCGAYHTDFSYAAESACTETLLSRGEIQLLIMSAVHKSNGAELISTCSSVSVIDGDEDEDCDHGSATAGLRLKLASGVRDPPESSWWLTETPRPLNLVPRRADNTSPIHAIVPFPGKREASTRAQVTRHSASHFHGSLQTCNLADH
jgi:hypothetical protein